LSSSYKRNEQVLCVEQLQVHVGSECELKWGIYHSRIQQGELIEFVRAVHGALQRILQRSGMGADVSNYLPDEHVE
jgi:hypothetical protein